MKKAAAAASWNQLLVANYIADLDAFIIFTLIT